MMKASGSKHSLNKYYGATAEDLENTAGLLEMTSVLGSSQIDENASGTHVTDPILYFNWVLLILPCHVDIDVQVWGARFFSSPLFDFSGKSAYLYAIVYFCFFHKESKKKNTVLWLRIIR